MVHAVERGIPGTGRFRPFAGGPGFEVGADARRVHVVAVQDRQGVGVGRPVRRRRAAGDRRGVVADDVAEDEADDRRRGGRGGKAAALDRRAVLADGVDPVDRSARRQQGFGDRPEVGKVQVARGRGQQRAPAAAHDRQDQRPLVGPRCQVEDPSRGRAATLVRHRVAGLQYLDVLDF